MSFLEFIGLIAITLVVFFALGHITGVLEIKFDVREKD